ncbi:MAG: tetratricopeptide repeat protein, partial [Anaerolineales bacterium]|nr:tetratricopeptide repeat protein [Anaerolineales bacterium]
AAPAGIGKGAPMSQGESDDAGRAEALFHLGYRYQMSGELDLAIQAYSESIELVPTAEAYTFRGWAYSFKGDLDRAIEDCRLAIEVDPEFGNPYNDIGAYLIERGDYERAIPWLHRALTAKRYANYHYARFNLGRAYLGQGLMKRAIAEFEQALELDGEYEPAIQALEVARSKLN